jgi:aryl-alcohol dehydrogenase-like predicted oxidoreductase
MKYRKLGSSDLEVSAICLGTMTFGTQNDQAEAHAQLDRALAAGINFIDTAEMYSVPPTAESYGRSETIVGHWLKRQQRDKIVLASKAAGPGRGMPWIREGGLSFNRNNLRTALEDSLRRLQTDYLDLYQLHWPDRNVPMFGQSHFEPKNERSTVPIRETLEVLGEFVAEGKVRAIGLSNETPWGVMQFLRLADELNLPRIVSIQNAYNLLNRTYEMTLTEIGYRENLALLAYSPLAFGLLTGKYLHNPQARGRKTLFEGFVQRYNKPHVHPAVLAYAEVAQRHGLTPGMMALAFVHSRWFVTCTLIGATSMAQLEGNLAAFEVRLEDTALKEIESVFARFGNPAP